MMTRFFEGPTPKKNLFEKLAPFEKFRSSRKEEAKPGGITLFTALNLAQCNSFPRLSDFP